MIKQIEDPGVLWEVIVIGGGASGLGIGLEAITRGYRTLLLEQCDFAKGTSSRSTKLIHGGVRYLAQGKIGLVMEALRERGILKRNAPHLVKDLAFIIPCYRWGEIILYTLGLTIYDLLAGRRRIGRSMPLSRSRTMRLLPSVKTAKLRGGLIYHDCQFDDSRLAINLCQTFHEHGGVAINYMEVKELLKQDGKTNGVLALDRETGREYRLLSKHVVNATGIFVNNIIRLDNPDCRNLVVPSQGIHLVVDSKFLNGKDALMIPKTSDGRVLFAIPWYNRVVIGTTDVAKKTAELEPRAMEEEIEYILETTRRYFEIPPEREDVLSVFAGLRPLAAPSATGKKTKEISRGHRIMISGSGLVSLTGGKWTTYRKIGEDVINRIEARSGLTMTRSLTGQLKIRRPDQDLIGSIIEETPEMGRWVSEKLRISGAQIILAIRHEMARTLEDVLARRTRALHLDASESIRMAPAVAELMTREMGMDDPWKEAQIKQYTNLAKGYML
jgi:glycerol-3-phosphate dehydrogenase